MALQKIEIDWDIHKAIEAERKGFDEPPYLALRRLLGLAEPTEVETKPEVPPAAGSGVPWVEDGVQVPHGSLARMSYLRNTQHYEGQFLNGRLVVEGQVFATLSAAANALAVTRDGTKTQLNGWNYWEVQFPGDKKWRSLKAMRSQAS